MAGFLYYVAAQSRIDRAALDGLGLGDVFRDATIRYRGTDTGPHGQGVVFRVDRPGVDEPLLGCWSADADRLEAAQRWQAAQGFWVGYYEQCPPLPADLARERPIEGHNVRLADGHDWLIPVARRFPAGTALPQSLVLSSGGELEAQILPRYAEFGRRAEDLWRTFMAYHTSDEKVQASIRDWWDLCVEALSLNYRIERWGVSLLGLLTTANLHDVCAAIIDVPTLLQVMAEQSDQKKRAECATGGGSSTASGEKANSPATGRATPTLSGSAAR